MPPPPKLTAAEWTAIRRRVLTRALELTKSVPKASELTQAAILKALEPDTTAWNPARHKTYADYLCDLAWSLHGNEIQSYRVTRASEALLEEDDPAAPSSSEPAKLALAARKEERATRMRLALQKRIEGDPLILVLLEPDAVPVTHEAPSDSPGSEMSGEDAPEAPAPPKEKTPHNEAASTRRALAKGYTDKEIKNARERLKRHALAVAREDRKDVEEDP